MNPTTRSPLAAPAQALAHLRRLAREGRAVLGDDPLDPAGTGRWCARVEQYLLRLAMPLPRLDLDPDARVRSPLDLLDADPDELERVRAQQAAGTRQRLRRKLTAIASAMERVELLLEARPSGTNPEVGGLPPDAFQDRAGI